jgi:hypothetical protein
MNKLVIGVIPSGAHDDLPKHMEIWVIESGMDADLTTVKLNGSSNVLSVQSLSNDLDANKGKVLGILVPVKLLSKGQTEALETLAKTHKIAFYKLT